MKKIGLALLIVGILAAGYYGIRLLPLFIADNHGQAKVVLLHGLGRSEYAMLLLESTLTDAGFDVHNIGYPSIDESPEVLLDMVSEKIDACCIGGEQTLHFVGHSLGGLLIRGYLGRRRPANLGRVVLLGVPNKGSELADADESLSDTLVELAGPTARALRTGPDGFPASLPPPDYPVGVIAGTRDNPVSNEWLPVPNDGMVTVESARLDGMTDFITFKVTHWGLRSDPEVAAQVVEFLLHGRFAVEAQPGNAGYG